MDLTSEEFFHDFRQELLADAEADGEFQVTLFMEAMAAELIETGFVDGFNPCHFSAARGMKVDGYWFDDEGNLSLFIADYDTRKDLESLKPSEITPAFKRLLTFYVAATEKQLYNTLEETSPEYGLARQIRDMAGKILKLNLFLLSERILSDRFQTIEDSLVGSVPVSYHVWDISRLQRQRSSRDHKEALEIDLREMFGEGVPCLAAHAGSDMYESYLAAIPGNMLAGLYEKYGARLLEQNVRSFLQARAKVNKGIRLTIINEPQMFFAYNNGITATAKGIETEPSQRGLELVKIKDLQIVNGGQTTASLFHSRRKDKASLDSVFVQMKLSVIDSSDSETVVPRISEYANTQNRVNAADFFSNHPFHIRIEDFSRRIWAPASQGSQRETKWFYERARGQYADAQSKLSQASQRRFKAEYPKSQMFTKTDLAKYENVWDDHPKWVNMGSQKNFAEYAKRIGKAWKSSSDGFNEYYYHRIIARFILFKYTEKVVSSQPWYGGYRANLVNYTLAAIGECCNRRKRIPDYKQVWVFQHVPDEFAEAILESADFVRKYVLNPPTGISNISEWAKKDLCWQRIVENIDTLQSQLPEEFIDGLLTLKDEEALNKQAKNEQKLEDNIKNQCHIVQIPKETWAFILKSWSGQNLLTPKEAGILEQASLPDKVPSEKQSAILLTILKRAKAEGIIREGDLGTAG